MFDGTRRGHSPKPHSLVNRDPPGQAGPFSFTGIRCCPLRLPAGICTARQHSALVDHVPRVDDNPEYLYHIRYVFRPKGATVTAAISASEARKTLFPLIERVNDDHTPVEIVSKRGNAVLVSKEDWDAIMETNYLLRSPANARRLMESVEQWRAGNAAERDLDTRE